jgi:tetratricopeptide (TPR) repeat protein
VRSSPTRRMMKRVPVLVGAALFPFVVLGACSGDGAGERIPLDRMGGAPEVVEELPAGLQIQLDSGNAAYRTRDYHAALRHFENAAEIAPGLAAGWYGIGMTQAALGNREAADSAMMEVHRLAPEVPLQHPGAAPPNPHQNPPARIP